MPSSITHAYIAKDVYSRLDKKIKTKFQKNDLENFKTYSQGPDLFYFYNIFFPISKKSRDIIKFGRYCHHNQVNELFINLTKKVKKSKNFDEFLFLIGLTCHYIADSTMHPYINYQSSLLVKKNYTNRDAHFKIETYLDNYMIKKNEKINYKEFKVHEFCFNLEKNENVVNLLNKSFQEVFNENNIGEIYFKSLKDMKLFFKYLRYDHKKCKNYFYNFANIFAKRIFRDVRYLSYNFDLDNDNFYLNLNHDIWHNVENPNLKSNLSFLELYREVVLQTKLTIEKLYEYVYENKRVDLEKLFGNKSYSTGLIIDK